MALLIAAAPPGLAAAMAILVIVIASDAWLVACVIFWIIAFPLYLTGRRQ